MPLLSYVFHKMTQKKHPNELGLNSVRNPSWNEVGICEVILVLPFLVPFLQFGLNNTHQVAVVIVDNVSGLTVLKTVAVVKQ